MKKIIIFFCFLLSIQTAFCQNLLGQNGSQGIDAMLQNIASQKDESRRINLIINFFESTQETNPELDIQKAQALKVRSEKEKDKIAEAMALSQIGYDYRAFGNTIKGMEYNLKAIAIAEQTGNIELIAFVNILLAHHYKDLADYPKAITLYLSAEENAAAIKSDKLQSWALMNLGATYYSINKLDSALLYSQKAYELCIRIGYTDDLNYILMHLAGVYGKMGDPGIAIRYYSLAIKQSIETNSAKALNQSYTALAQYYHAINENDSSIVYARAAIATVQNTAFSNKSVKPAKLLLDIYRNNNIDSAFKYSEIYRSANDSLFSAKTIQQTQLLTFEEEVRQQELAAERIKAAEERKHNIQYALIALGIIIFIILYLLLGSSFITNIKLIEFFGVIALLIVFEFLNLLLTPFLESITHHLPVLMLLALVCIAALLTPLHHKAEKWAITTLIKKNKKIRLANAKKTTEQLQEEK